MTALLVLLIPTMFFVGVASVVSFHFKHEALRRELAVYYIVPLLLRRVPNIGFVADEESAA